MWPYKQINRKDFETIKEKVEKYMVFLGAEKQIVDVPYEQTTTSYVRNVCLIDDDDPDLKEIKDGWCWFKARKMRYHVIPC